MYLYVSWILLWFQLFFDYSKPYHPSALGTARNTLCPIFPENILYSLWVVQKKISKISLELQSFSHIFNHMTVFGLSLDPLWTVFEPSLNRFWTVFGMSLDRLWTVFGPSFDWLWTVFWPSLNGLGPYVDHLWTIPKMSVDCPWTVPGLTLDLLTFLKPCWNHI